MVALACGVGAPVSLADDAKARATSFEAEVAPLLETYCHACHGDGRSKGDVSFDGLEKSVQNLESRKLWLRIWKNLRTDLMPPVKRKQPTEAERKKLIAWIEREILELDPAASDPARVTMRRLNRVEYRHTIQDLLAVDYDATRDFPPDDTGYGFDTIGDVLTLSPLLMEKYLSAAEKIMAQAIPERVGSPEPVNIDPRSFRGEDRRTTARFLRAGIAHRVGHDWEAKAVGKHRFEISYQIDSRAAAKGHAATWQIHVGGEKRASQKISSDDPKPKPLEIAVEVPKTGTQRIELEMVPPEGIETGRNFPLAVRVLEVQITAPVGGIPWESYPESYRRVFTEGLPAGDSANREGEARKILAHFAMRAYRRPVDDETLAKLVELAKSKGFGDQSEFEAGIRFASTAVLASPEFLFRGESYRGDGTGKAKPIDEYSLASRLSYFLWSSTPDEDLLKLAREGKLREQLRATVDRMLLDAKSERFARHFVGQWLQTRDLDGRFFDTPHILGGIDGGKARQIFNLFTRVDMKRETELFFRHLLVEKRPAVELITADYSFLNDRLAKFYGVDGVSGSEFRKISLESNPRLGGILSQGSFLITTSNPTRTSPVKRGLFVLDNLLGVPPPPAPPEIPELEETRKKLGENPTVAEMLAQHRADPLCRSCHARMDPIGLALESFNAIGQWRRGKDKPVDTSGVLVTGETFDGIAGLRKVLSGPRRKDFHRCLTEKLLTYSLGRGVEYYDAPSVDKIVAEAEEAGGGLRDFLYGIIESAPFQLVRGGGADLRRAGSGD